MKPSSIKSRLYLSFVAVILLLGTVIGLFGYHILKTNVVQRAQRRAENDMRTARLVFQSEINDMGRAFNLISQVGDPNMLRRQLDLDYLFVVNSGHADTSNEIVRRAVKGNATGGVRIIDSTELIDINEGLYARSEIKIRSTPMARRHGNEKTVVSRAMALEYAMPFFDSFGQVSRVIYGGKILNRNFALIDRIHSAVYENRIYNSKPVGTVTIFLGDVRIATNVLDRDGQRALGTRVSDAVYANVIKDGKPFLDRAFVVTDWYLSAYEPVRDVNGAIVGILYVGTLEQPFTDMLRRSSLFFFLIIIAAAFVAVALSVLLAGGITGPLSRLVTATASLAEGDMEHRVEDPGTISELNRLALSFNEMAEKLEQRDQSLRSTNEALEVLNKRYLDLVGMVSHELKGILASVVMNAYSVRDGHLGEINPLQKKALDGLVRNLEYFDNTIKNFLNLSRIEKNELNVNRADIHLKRDVVDVTLETFTKQAEARKMVVENSVSDEVPVFADSSLIQMALNNLVGNAVKYGAEGGRIQISVFPDSEFIKVSVYNDGRPLSEEERGKLFRRFSRLDSTESRRVHGTGLGLFITKQIVEAHGGSIEAVAREKGNEFVFTLPVRKE